MEPIRVLVTGAAGQISYSLLPMILSGDVFGSDQPIILHLLEIPVAIESLNAVKMELEDCAFKLLTDILVTPNLEEAFRDIDVAFLVGARPRGPGMERKDLLKANVKIFMEQGIALNQYAKKDVLVLVVGNPANTNCYICAQYAPSLPKKNFSAMTRLDENRAKSMIAKEMGTHISNVENVFIWGNHSSTQQPDASKAIVKKDKAEVHVSEVLKNNEWFKNTFKKAVQQRGAEVIKARKASSAMSAAKAACDHMKAWWCNTKDDPPVSMAIIYENCEAEMHIPNDLVFSYPVRIHNKQWSIAKEFFHDEIHSELKETIDELLAERNEAKTCCNL